MSDGEGADVYRIVAVEEPDNAMWGAIGGGIHEYNVQQVGGPAGKRVCFVLYGPEQEIAGGLIGETHWNWLFVDLLWVEVNLRGRGYGGQLLALAEEEARGRGATDAYLDTFSFQAPDFYTKQGYQVFGELHDFPPGHRRYFLQKHL